ncbi:hypothetical protein [Desulfurispira natronophila]|uniref:Uncharacterized protein n=1 Tax=Desulfurispira natronophila TaxID=682562 RepID=A0A7W7Y455_9BACT|nr:hypothetical protein [Desulfurispira natronophila]MBB5021748.1 hypothetical protein [Desulfurispira natronophila]
MKLATVTRIFALGAGLLLLPGCYIYSYYPETDTYVTTVETKKYVNQNYSRERFMRPNNSDCYACHNSQRIMVPYHQGTPHAGAINMQPQHRGLPQGHPSVSGQSPQQHPQQQQWQGGVQPIPGMPGFYSGPAGTPHMVPMTPSGPALGAVPPMMQPGNSQPMAPATPPQNGQAPQAPQLQGNTNESAATSPETNNDANNPQQDVTLLGPYR